jgi:aspartate racemase
MGLSERWLGGNILADGTSPSLGVTHPIGVIGGLGPNAGLLLVERIFASTVASRDQDHLPIALLSYADRIPDRSAFLAGEAAVNPAGPMLEVAAALAGLGARVAGVACNTAHVPAIWDVFIEGLPGRAPGLRVLHLVDEAVAHVAERAPGATRIGLLATLGTYRAGIYAERLELAGLVPVLPDPRVRADRVHRAIYDPVYGIKARPDPVSRPAMDDLYVAIDHLAARGAEAVILGCTEFSVAFRDPSTSPLPLVDASTALARALIRETAPERLRPLA